MKELSVDHKFDLIYQSNQRLLLCVSHLIEHIDELTMRIAYLEDKEIFYEPYTRTNTPN